MPPVRHVRVRIIIRTVIYGRTFTKELTYETPWTGSTTTETVDIDDNTEKVTAALTALQTGDPDELNGLYLDGTQVVGVDAVYEPAE